MGQPGQVGKQEEPCDRPRRRRLLLLLLLLLSPPPSVAAHDGWMMLLPPCWLVGGWVGGYRFVEVVKQDPAKAEELYQTALR